jgi:CDGSH-type Zn-finger protein
MGKATIRAVDNGPYVISGDFEVVDGKGNKIDTSGKLSIALCRCGKSGNMPFCDGAHLNGSWEHGYFESEVRTAPSEEESDEVSSEEETGSNPDEEG